ncbi:MAG: GNAT family N-acetyltransferase [Phycisphaerales bacterium]|nr:GNAT family N-acetyltransferase [Phycisphaerales bacterium]
MRYAVCVPAYVERQILEQRRFITTVRPDLRQSNGARTHSMLDVLDGRDVRKASRRDIKTVLQAPMAICTHTHSQVMKCAVPLYNGAMHKVPDPKLTSDVSECHIKRIIDLADANTTTLGFIPAEVVAREARAGHILCALDVSGEVLGYLWFTVTRNPYQARVHHLCVDDRFRNRGVGLSLVDELKKRTRQTFGIALRCGRDLPAHKFWSSIGFIAKGERRGRGLQPRILTCFWYDHRHPSLEGEQFAKLAAEKVIAVVDSNIVFDIAESSRPRHQHSTALLADWLSEFVALYVADEVYNEIDRHEHAELRERGRQIAHSLGSLPVSADAVDTIASSLRSAIKVGDSTSSRSDIRHIAASIAACARYFVTNDGDLLDHAELLEESTGLQLLTPLQFILDIDEVRRKAAYEPARLAGTELVTRPVAAFDAHELFSYFRNCDADESQAQFDAALREALTDPSLGISHVILAGEKPAGLLAIIGTTEGAEIRLFRTARVRLSATIARHLAKKAIQYVARERDGVLLLNDSRAPQDIRAACFDLGFLERERNCAKVVIRGILDETVAAKAIVGVVEGDSYEVVPQEPMDADKMFWLEKAIWPGFVRNKQIDNFLIPIQPRWAKELFEERLAAQNLIPSDEFLALHYENVYYRSGHQQIVRAPGRVLWYVSGEAGYSGTSCVCACSHIDEVLVGAPKEVFARFRRLGVFQWRDVSAIAEGNPGGQVCAIRFSGTRLLSRPMKYKRLRELLFGARGKTPQLTTALKLQHSEFYSILEATL